MNKNITNTKRALVDRLFAILHRDYRECTIYIPGLETIVPDSNAIEIKRLDHFDFNTSVTTYRYKLNVVRINDEKHWEWETEITKFESLDPETRDRLVAFLNTKCDNAPAPFGAWLDMPTTLVGRAYYFTL